MICIVHAWCKVRDEQMQPPVWPTKRISLIFSDNCAHCFGAQCHSTMNNRFPNTAQQLWHLGLGGGILSPITDQVAAQPVGKRLPIPSQALLEEQVAPKIGQSKRMQKQRQAVGGKKKRRKNNRKKSVTKKRARKKTAPNRRRAPVSVLGLPIASSLGKLFQTRIPLLKASTKRQNKRRNTKKANTKQKRKKPKRGVKKRQTKAIKALSRDLQLLF